MLDDETGFKRPNYRDTSQDGPDGYVSRRRYRLTFGHFMQTAPWTDRRLLAWPDLVTLLTTHEVGSKEGACFTPAVFRGARRHKSDAEQIDLAVLDSDSGVPLDEIRSAIAARGWQAITASTHSHLTTTTSCKRSNWDRYRAQHGADAAGYLVQDKGYLPAVAAGAAVVCEVGDDVTFRHQPCPKFRIVLPLARPWRAADHGSQKLANEAWRERVEAVAAALRLRHDQSCTDTSRLFYLPRRPADGLPPEIAILEGAPCDIFSLPTVTRAARTERPRKRKASPLDPPEVTDAMTGEVFDLSLWERSHARRFEIVTALRARRPDVLLGRVVERKHHLRCVNAATHTSATDDFATIAINASESESGRFVLHCMHNHCAEHDHLAFLKQMIEQGWLSVSDLINPDFLVGGKPPPPTIQYTPGKLHEIVDQAEQALITANLGLYQRGTFIVRVGTVRTSPAATGEGERRRIIHQGDRAIVEAMTEAANWEKFDRRSEAWVSIDAPISVANTYLQRIGRWDLRVLTGLLNAPTLRADGSILSAPGYDEATGLLLEVAAGRYPSIPAQPTWTQARAALDVLITLIAEFPFVGPVDRSVAVSAVLTGVVRRSLRTAPLHGFDAPVAGSGKSKLVDIATLTASGQLAAVIAQGRTEEELEKRLAAQLLAGEAGVAIDNCEGPLGGDFLCQMLTQTTVRMRILGRSEVPELPTTALVTATGNNLTLMGDMTRRAILCRLDPQCERPELRRFASDPITTLRAERSRYLVAALTVLRAFHVAGRPRQADPLGSFEDWSDWVRGALIWLGEADPVVSMETIRAEDPKLEAITAVMTQWWSALGDRRVAVRAVIDAATAQRTLMGSIHSKQEFVQPDFREALLAVAGEGGAVNSRRLGRWLAANEGRIVGRWRFERGGEIGGAATWTLREIREVGREAA
ncbi:hypothetical protein [Neoroseomonas soli]|uniref:RepB-like DNA primase domain-containing protein n=1 Tax=Neoroseomonas soli TaxID=1081025 RepID=A0A9X9WTT1_9PROT|nr:hypothetical protein [Neoroseomonas soli]MBR0670560.1 hypothetical protein [Neoroseomonas soli]